MFYLQIKEFEMVLKELFYATNNSNNILVPMGGDFHYQVAEEQYTNIDKLIE